jgi:hypothetical protein
MLIEEFNKVFFVGSFAVYSVQCDDDAELKKSTQKILLKDGLLDDQVWKNTPVFSESFYFWG